MHAIGSGIVGNSEYQHETSALNTTSQCIYNVSSPKLDKYLPNIFCITVIKQPNNEKLGQFASTGVRLCLSYLNVTSTVLSLSGKNMS